MPSLARSVPKPLKVPSLARSVSKKCAEKFSYGFKNLVKLGVEIFFFQNLHIQDDFWIFVKNFKIKTLKPLPWFLLILSENFKTSKTLKQKPYGGKSVQKNFLMGL